MRRALPIALGLVLTLSSFAQAPVVTSVTPSRAPYTGLNTIYVHGSGFTGATQVLFGPNAAVFSVANDGEIVADLGVSTTLGLVDVSVTTPGGTGTLEDRFYLHGPTLFFEDFEGGGPGWTVTGTPQVLWHVSSDGECGSVTHMGAYNRFPSECDYATGGPNNGRLRSPVFTLSGAPVFNATFECLKSMDMSGDVAGLHLVDANDSQYSIIRKRPGGGGSARYRAGVAEPILMAWARSMDRRRR
jgi:hypothetical protein